MIREILKIINFAEYNVHTETFFLNLVKSNQNCSVITLFQLIWQQMEFRLMPNQLEKFNYILKLFGFKKIQKSYLCVLLS